MVDNIVNSFLSIYDQQGKLPIWPLWNGETNCMPGYSSVPIIADAYLKGFKGFDATKAFNCMISTATNDAQNGVKYVKEKGYIPCDKIHEATSIAMEYAADDWGIALMFHNTRSRAQIKAEANTLFVDSNVFASTQAVIHTRMIPQGIKIVVGNYKTFQFTPDVFGAIVQFPNSDGLIEDYKEFISRANANETRVAVAADLMSLVLLTPPGEWGADVVFGSSQRFGIPMFYGGPSAAFFATKEDYKRTIPGRIIGISKDVYGHPAFRLALQTREQHIKREKATSNICTAQALLATMAGFYAIYHGSGTRCRDHP